jgi:predicted RNA binding protein YcfA (HicA-like mRNA interferase family)
MTRVAADPRSWRELRVRLQALGARKARTNGSHEVWRFKDGHRFVVVCNHLSDSVPVGILVKFRRRSARYGAIENDDPPLRGRGRGHGGLVLAERTEKIWQRVIALAARAPVPTLRAARKAVERAMARAAPAARAPGRAPAMAGTGPPRNLARRRVRAEVTRPLRSRLPG